ncbi:MAG: septal ring lytic transglycosylase RlpA family protein [Candidatus Andersenbacteria bacterium]|nr:septal ring lytic transglycosylase RlpA family protein [Candidatus Andersenbacteria bacterium]
MRSFATLRHKNLTNTTLNTAIKTIAIAIIATFTTHNALAFSLPAEITPVISIPDKTPELSYGYMSGTVMSSGSPVTDAGTWEVKTVKPVAKPQFKSGSNLVMEGMASYYSKAGCLGCNPLFVMANGEQLDDNALTMAIGADKSNLVGYQARVTNLANGKSVVVRITDTGGFYQDKYGNRVADLTIGTKTAIGMNGGLGKVRIEVL